MIGGGLIGTAVSWRLRQAGLDVVVVIGERSAAASWVAAGMRQAGFKTKVQPVGVNRHGVGYVIYSNPGAGAEAPQGSTVILYVV